MDMIYSSLDKEPVLTAKAEVINLGAPTLANQRLMAAYINELLDTCAIDATPSVLDFADKFIGEPVGLAEGSLMMQLYDNIHCNVARKLAERVNAGDYALHPEIQAGYRLAYLMHKVMTERSLGFGLKPFREKMRESMTAALNELEAEAIA